jgi:FlaG/FlaF family flagellin (archaellin)
VFDTTVLCASAFPVVGVVGVVGVGRVLAASIRWMLTGASHTGSVPVESCASLDAEWVIEYDMIFS